MKYWFYTFFLFFISCLLYNKLSDKSHDYSVTNALGKTNTKTIYKKLKSESTNHEQAVIKNTNHISVYRKEYASSYNKRPVFLEIDSYWDKDRESRYIKYKIDNQISWQDAVTYVNIGLDTPRYSDICEIEDPEALDLWVDKYRKLPAKYYPKDLKQIKKKYCSRSLRLRSEACNAFETMCEAAIEDRIRLIAVSAFRDYEYQDKVYYRYYTKKMTINEYTESRDRVSARAGHSEHQSGFAVDVGCDEDSLLVEAFENTKAGIWIANNCVKYGFILRYPKNKEHITGYKYEPWHFRYLGNDLAEKVHDSGLTYDEFCARNLRTLTEDDMYSYKLSNDSTTHSNATKVKHYAY